MMSWGSNGGIMKFARLFIGAIHGVGLLALFAFSPVHAQPAFDPGLQRAIEVQERHTDSIMTNPGVVGTAVGRDIHGTPAVLILVEKTGAPGLPGTLDGVPVLVRRTGRIHALPKCAQPPCGNPGSGSGGTSEPSRTARWPRPVPIGISTGHPAITAGTIGARVTDGTKVYALSNNHVYANENHAADGDAVIQPGTFDGGSSTTDKIGALSAYVPIRFNCGCVLVCVCSGSDNTVDAAIALTTPEFLRTSTPSDGYGEPRSTTIAPAIDMKVKKYGRTTGPTTGRITAINATVVVGYSRGYARFTNQIMIEPGSFSAGGDSGSLIVVDGKGRAGADDRKAVGLLFAGSSFVTIANPIDEVLVSFGVTIEGAD